MIQLEFFEKKFWIDKPDEKQIFDCLNCAFRYSEIQESHHRKWVIDQMVRILLKDKYFEIIREYNSDNEYPLWDEGISP
jgi:hypothetical protein